jgi:hypothetical protein
MCRAGCSATRYELRPHNPLQVEKDYEHDFDTGFRLARLLRPRRVECFPLWTLNLGLRIITVHPRFVSCYHVLEIFRSEVTRSRNSNEIDKRCSFCSGVKMRGTNFALTRLCSKHLLKCSGLSRTSCWDHWPFLEWLIFCLSELFPWLSKRQRGIHRFYKLWCTLRL